MKQNIQSYEELLNTYFRKNKSVTLPTTLRMYNCKPLTIDYIWVKTFEALKPLVLSYHRSLTKMAERLGMLGSQVVECYFNSIQLAPTGDE